MGMAYRHASARADGDGDRIDADEVRALLSEQAELHARYHAQVPPELDAARIAAVAILRQWLNDPSAIDVQHLRPIRVALKSNGEWWVRTHGHDPGAGARVQLRVLLGRMDRELRCKKFSLRANIGSREPRRFPANGYRQAKPRVVVSRGMNTAAPDKPDIRVIVGHNIRQLREAADFSGRALAARLGISPSKLSDYEHGRGKPSDARLIEIAETCELSKHFGVEGIGWFYDPHPAEPASEPQE